MKKIFITGEEGVIPKFMTKIINDSDSFCVVEYPMTLKTHNSFAIRNYELDFTSNNFEACIKANKPDIIIHSGAYVGTDFCANATKEACLSNVYGTKNIVDICNKYDIDLVYLSTTAIFDPESYSQAYPITENSRINPKTYYGITKYAGELTVRNECKTKWLVVRPVFGFSEFPHDLHSALTKYIYALYNDVELTILLDKKINKSYTHAKNIAACILNIVKDEKWYSCFNIGKHYLHSRNWYSMFAIFESLGLTISNKITFIPDKDYLHWHNIDNSKVREYFTDNTFVDDVSNVIDSVKENSNIKPYWL